MTAGYSAAPAGPLALDEARSLLRCYAAPLLRPNRMAAWRPRFPMDSACNVYQYQRPEGRGLHGKTKTQNQGQLNLETKGKKNISGRHFDTYTKMTRKRRNWFLNRSQNVLQKSFFLPLVSGLACPIIWILIFLCPGYLRVHASVVALRYHSRAEALLHAGHCGYSRCACYGTCNSS